MMKSLRLFAIFLLIAASASVVQAGGTKGFQGDLIGQLQYGQKQVEDLMNAIPDAKMTWRPNADVRSISEVYSHIAFGNYLFAKFVGATLPADVVIAGPQDEKKWETASADKKVIKEQLDKSFAFLASTIGKMSDADLDKVIDFFGQKMSTRSMLLILQGHVHEHLGQSIAYARMVGVVPPWTAARAAAQDKMK